MSEIVLQINVVDYWVWKLCFDLFRNELSVVCVVEESGRKTNNNNNNNNNNSRYSSKDKSTYLLLQVSVRNLLKGKK